MHRPPGGYALDFTLPTFGKSGCLVCHGDPNLVVAKGDATHSYWIDEEAYDASAHATVICTGCHIDYGYKAPHGQAAGTGARWPSSRARTATDPVRRREPRRYASSRRPGAPDPKAASKPLCGDCHGGHDI